MVRRLLILAVAALMAGTVAAPAASAAQRPLGSGAHVISSVIYPNPCLDVDPATRYDNGQVRTWECNAAAWQQWVVDYPVADVHTHHIYLAGTAKCLTAVPASWIPSGWIVETRDCISGDYHQLCQGCDFC
jgi:hypothetical protein